MKMSLDSQYIWDILKEGYTETEVVDIHDL